MHQVTPFSTRLSSQDRSTRSIDPPAQATTQGPASLGRACSQESSLSQGHDNAPSHRNQAPSVSGSSRRSTGSSIIVIPKPPLYDFTLLRLWLRREFPTTFLIHFTEFLYRTVGIDSYPRLQIFINTLNAKDILDLYGSIRYNAVRMHLGSLQLIWTFIQQYNVIEPPTTTQAAFLRLKDAHYNSIMSKYPHSDLLLAQTQPQPPAYTPVSPFVRDSWHQTDTYMLMEQ